MIKVIYRIHLGRLVTAVLATSFIFASQSVRAEETTFVYAVQISAAVQTSPPQITLNWKPDPYGANSYTVYRKSKTDTSWGAGTSTFALGAARRAG